MERPAAVFPGWLRRVGFYVLALLFVAAAATLRWALPGVLGPTPFLAFYLAWVGAAAFGGLGPGLVATVASWWCVELFFDFTPGVSVFDDPTAPGRLVILLAGGLTVSLVAEAMRRGRIRERRHVGELRATTEELQKEVEDRKQAEKEREALLRELKVRAGELQEANELLAAANAELAATNEELKATTEELQAEIEDRKRAEQALRMSEERFRTLHALSPIAIVLNRLDNGQFLESNQALWDMTGYTEREFRSLTYWDITPIEYKDMEAKQLELLHTVGRYGPYEKEYIRKDGSRFPVLLSGVRIQDPGGTDLIYSVIQDITELKAKEQALREMNATLEEKVAQRTAELERRAGQLQKLTLELTEAEERERRRIAVVLHEDLQQQIAGARFQLKLVRSRAGDEAQRAHLDKVDDMLTATIANSRSLSRDLSPAVMHMNDLAEVLQWLVNRVREQHGLSVSVTFLGDMMLHSEALATFLFRAAQEMLLNVVKHARVHEAAIRVRRIGRYVCLSVCDQGRGFDPQKLPETSGVGLFGIRERTESLGGRLKVRSAKGRGSRFRVTVPDDAEVGSTSNVTENMVDFHALASAVSSPSPGFLRVLLVDDHDIVRDGLAALLREAPDILVVGEAPDGREAIDLAIGLKPDVVIMDVSMPVMSGDQATRQIKTYVPATRVIALSMYDEADKKERMFLAGAERYVLKTASAEELLAAIRGRESDG